MKKVEAIIRPQPDDVKSHRGCTKHLFVEVIRTTEGTQRCIGVLSVDFVPKAKLEIILADEKLQEAIDAVLLPNRQRWGWQDICLISLNRSVFVPVKWDDAI